MKTYRELFSEYVTRKIAKLIDVFIIARKGHSCLNGFGNDFKRFKFAFLNLLVFFFQNIKIKNGKKQYLVSIFSCEICISYTRFFIYFNIQIDSKI